ncbi:polysaccharide deacetylase family protein [Rhizobium sp. FKY42]|uniref:polysaccharide deacetylase family protein n=1 Tax=Rhizobium sp. FKY42 TaxID=2562310 RepID=UPI0010BF6797|nr:polysaccharide deacetylase family protein [Rhizobium sp. FKY42]
MAKNAFLTFDDGPNVGTAVVLDKLKDVAAPATFFLTGSNGFDDAKEKVLVERMLKEGHQIGNHCFVHKPSALPDYKATYGDLTQPAQKTAFKKNLTDNVAHFRAVTGKPTLNFSLARLPGDGRFHPPSVTEVGNLGLRHIGWKFEFAPNGVLEHIKNLDWQGIAGVAATDAGFPKDNDIILAHDAHWKNDPSLFAALLKKLMDNGFQFKAIDERAIA